MSDDLIPGYYSSDGKTPPARTTSNSTDLPGENLLNEVIKVEEPTHSSVQNCHDEQTDKLGTEDTSIEPFAYYDAPTGKYLIRNQHMWITHTSAQMKRRLRINGVSTRYPEGEIVSEAEILIQECEDHFSVNYAGELAGHNEGFSEQCGKRILVTRGPTLLEIQPGIWPTLEKTFEAVLHDEESDQLTYFYGWLKYAVQSLRSGRLTAGQAIAIAGEAGCGKSLIQNLITDFLGGRSAKPYQYMTGKTAFNSDMFTAEHLMIEDEAPNIDIKSRRSLGSNIKQMTVNENQRLHAKNRDAIMVKPFWRLSITLNDEPEDLHVLPPIDHSLEDKLILFRGHKRTLPMETNTIEKRSSYRQQLRRETPAFLHWLLHDFEIPEALKSERFGITHFHHPDLIGTLRETTPEAKLLELIDQRVDIPFKGTALELETILRECAGRPAEKLLYFAGAAAAYLGRLARLPNSRVQQRRTRTTRYWEISKP